MTNHQSWNVSYKYTFSSPMIVHQKKNLQSKLLFLRSTVCKIRVSVNTFLCECAEWTVMETLQPHSMLSIFLWFDRLALG